MNRPPKPEDTQDPTAAGLECDTIAAIATAPGQAGIGVVRLSGPRAATVATRLVGELPPPRLATLRKFIGADDQLIDSGLVLFFPGPNSFTGEDVVEFQGHGGPVVLKLLMEELLDAGARLARAGEFTERAYLNGKMDLAQAEAVADLIASASETAVRAANRSLSGVFSRRIHEIDDLVLNLRVYVEAAIDFSDEDIDLLQSGDVSGRLEAVAAELRALRSASSQGVLLRDGIAMALLGAPNVGKSSLLNALAGEDRAIVTEIPGTTRDLVRVPVHLDGMPVELVDTAGLRVTDDVVEREGVRRAMEQGRKADVVLLLTDLSEPEQAPPAELATLDSRALIRVGNKRDLLPESSLGELPDDCDVAISAATGEGIAELIRIIAERVGYQVPEAAFTARTRHLQALARAEDYLHRAMARTGDEAELIAEELREVQMALGEIVGEITPDDLLGEIFSSFCIGK
jgi:tRNA modification GTPase